jgi:hypothetical protein
VAPSFRNTLAKSSNFPDFVRCGGDIALVGF